jgi:hypothetical protein
MAFSRSDLELAMSEGAAELLAAASIALTAVLLTGCAVGPDFLHPAAPEITCCTREPLSAHTASADGAVGQRQHFVEGRDISEEWWATFNSPALNALIERAIANNPNLQSTLANLRAAKQSVYACWHTDSFSSAPVGDGYEVEVNEFDFRDDNGICYDKDGVVIRHWRRAHTKDGAVAYRLDCTAGPYIGVKTRRVKLPSGMSALPLIATEMVRC